MAPPQAPPQAPTTAPRSGDCVLPRLRGRWPACGRALVRAGLLGGVLLLAMADTRPPLPVGRACGCCGIPLADSGGRACRASWDAARRDHDWPYFPDGPGAGCKLCGEGPDAHRGLRTTVTGGLYCNAAGAKIPLCCNCGKDRGVSYFFAHPCVDCEERRRQSLALRVAPPAPDGPPARHLLILCHGLYGLPSELYAARDTLRGVPGCAVHCCESYGGAGTMQGVDEIGERIQAEVRDVIEAHARESDRAAFATISFVGHSMGGVVARSAVSKLFNASDGTILGLKPLLFVSTASPHLGVSNYGPLPRLPEALTAPLASVFAGKSGRDLFSIDAPDGIVRTLATDPAALRALGSFRARSAPRPPRNAGLCRQPPEPSPACSLVLDRGCCVGMVQYMRAEPRSAANVALSWVRPGPRRLLARSCHHLCACVRETLLGVTRRKVCPVTGACTR